MGKSGGTHAGSELTDSMILVKLDTLNKKITTVSIPRDLWIPEMKAKVNTAYYYGKNDLAKKTVGQIFDIPVHYSVLIDFSGFKNVIDAMGGIEVEVENSFTDKLYPIEGKENEKCIPFDPKYLCRYETVTFEEGKQVMNGERALKFVRSRHSVGDEGTDIARAKRQQKIIDAMKIKLTSIGTYKNINKDIEIYKALRSSIIPDFDDKTAAVIARKALEARGSVNSYLIPEELLINPKLLSLYDNQYVFIPKLGNGKWDDLQKWYKGL